MKPEGEHEAVALMMRPEALPRVEDDFNNHDFTTLITSAAMSPFLNTSSNPVSPRQVSPPPRPSSTPFLRPENHCADDCGIGSSDYDSDSELYDSASTVFLDRPSAAFEELPIEVNEAILDHLFGYRVSATSGSAMRISSVTRSWGTALRHSRRRELTELALVNRTWRVLIQQRLYRHVKLKATVESLEEAMVHFAEHEHLKNYVKHIEIWFPVFQPAYDPLAVPTTLTLPTVTSDGLTNAVYTLPKNNCTLEEAFRFVAHALPQATVLTLEGGERRKAPMVVHFHPGLGPRPLPVLDSIQTLVTKGQWNLMREDRDFATVLGALPNLVEWQASYHKPKSKSYITMSEFLPYLPNHLTNLNICLESDYRWEGVTPSFYTKVTQRTHICVRMAACLPALEHFAYTGRVCHQFFDVAARICDPRVTKLKSVDLTVKNCCRHVANIHESGSGIQDMGFIEAFERLVYSAVRALDKLKQVQYLRIRFMDLDSVLPPLNPYFLMRDGKCSGVWSEAIVREMARVRPENSFAELSETFGDVVYNKEGRMVIAPEYPRTKITSLKLSNYRSLATRITIQ